MEAAEHTTGSIYARGHNKVVKNNLQRKRKDCKIKRRLAKTLLGLLVLFYFYFYGNVALAPGSRETTRDSSGFTLCF